ncbi:SAVED domain-containing protein [Dyadobacter sp.]|uniref:SAVED domain-containing protein n=1 Tax=Dyadobacter sp. TaxID=1914288 RepID=UPI003F6E6A0F
MANSIIAITQGIFYQESIFWWQAARMLVPDNNIASIVWEANNVTGFDDVVVNYDPPILDKSTGDLVDVDFYQVKHHVDKSNFFSVEALIDPAFIGATSISLLQKLKNQQLKTLPSQKARYILVNTWGIDSNNVIGKLLGVGDKIRLDVLMQGKTDDSEMGKVRKLWREHLGFDKDEELYNCLSSLRIKSNFSDIHNILDIINPSLQLAGLYPIPETQVSNKYDGLITRLHGQNRNEFTLNRFRQLCKEEGLFAPQSPEYFHRVGIRTFLAGTENFEKENIDCLCLAHHYNDRKIKDSLLWQSHVLPDLRTFIQTVTGKEKKITFSLDTHLSLAFAVGYSLNPKLGVEASIIQKTKNSKILWEPHFEEQFATDTVLFDQKQMNASANEIALAISITHDVLIDVESFVSEQLPTVGRIIDAKINPGPSHLALKDGTHVLNVAQTIARQIQNMRTIHERSGKIHVFMAAPNAFAFYFGQYAAVLGNIVLYEFNFPATKAGDYQPVLTFPN